jgi:hypothetical protein
VAHRDDASDPARESLGPESDEAEDIEVGASGGDLRYWRAKEAVRQGEARLAAQSAIRTALEARATALTGWAAASLLAAAAAGFGTRTWPERAAITAIAMSLFGAAVTCIHASRPRDWAMQGYDPTVILDDTLGTELETLESIAEGLSPGIQDNNRRLNHMGRSLRVAGWLLITAPMSGAIVYGATRALTYERAALSRLYP